MNRSDAPAWVLSAKSMDEIAFGYEFLEAHPMIFTGGKFFDSGGEVEQEWLRYSISQAILPYYSTNIAGRTKSAAEALKLLCYSPELTTPEMTVNVRNGTLSADGSFSEKKHICRSRLNVRYVPHAPMPEKFLDFLGQLLAPEDIITLQEYLGYCLIPSTRGQKMMFIIGSGGEGKSRVGVVLREIFGSSMLTGSFQRIETDRFFRFNLTDKLLMLDDDMQMTALSTTGIIKNLITAETPVDVEAKGEQSRQAKVYSRFLCFANGSPRTLYDKTEGFRRRLLILSALPRPADRKDDPFIADSFIAEKDSIFLWMFLGLRRLIANSFRFTVSDRTRSNIDESFRDNCNVLDFLEESSMVRFGEKGSVSSNDLYYAYTCWCGDNALTAMKRDSFICWIRSNSDRFGIRYTNSIISSAGRKVRGFQGIALTVRLSAEP